MQLSKTDSYLRKVKITRLEFDQLKKEMVRGEGTQEETQAKLEAIQSRDLVRVRVRPIILN